MSSIFDYSDYKAYVNDWVQRQPKKGHGQFRKIADALSVTTVFISQVFRGDRDLQPEHVLPLSHHLALVDIEEKYMLHLVYAARAGSEDLRQTHKRLAAEVKKTAKDLKHRIKNEVELSTEALAQFHSSWVYSAVRLLTSIPEKRSEKTSVQRIAKDLQLGEDEVLQTLDFLVQQGLCVKMGDRFQMGPRQTHLPASSPYIKTRQISWRVKGFEKMTSQAHHDRLFFTAPMVISATAKQEILEKLRKSLVDLTKIASESESEKLCCLNVDWFEL